MSELLGVIEELLDEYSKKKGFEYLNLENENPEDVLKAIEDYYGKFSIKNFRHAMKYRTIFTNSKSMMIEFTIRSVENYFIKEISSKQFVDTTIDNIIYSNILSKEEMRDGAEDEIREAKEVFREQLFVSRKVLERKNKKMTFSRGNSESNINGKITLSKGDLNHLGLTEDDREYDLHWLSNGSILISKSKGDDK